MTGIIVTTPPTVELPPGNTTGGSAVLPGVTYTYAVLSLPQTWTAKQTFPLGNISIQAADIVGLPSAVPGGSNTQIQYNNSGAFAGITGATTNGTTLTLVAPVLGTPASGTLTNCTAFTLTTTGSSGAATYSAGALNIPQYSGGGSGLTACGRLTLITGVAVPRTSVSASANVYLTTYKGDSGPVYGGSTFSSLTFTELTNILANSAVGSAGPAATVPNAIYDFYFWSNGGTPTLTRSDYWKKSATVTMTIASPCVVTWSGSDFADGIPIVLTTSGALATGLTAGTTYFVKRTGAIGTATATFNLAATVGGAAINTTGSQSGTHTGTAGDDSGLVARASSGNCEQQVVLGIPLNKNAITNGPAALRGTFYGTGKTNASGTIDFIFGASSVAAVLHLCNAWNTELVTTCTFDSAANWNLTSNNIRPANGTANSPVMTGPTYIRYVCGSPSSGILVSNTGLISTVNVAFASGALGLAMDSTVAYDKRGAAVTVTANAAFQNIERHNAYVPQLGSRTFFALEEGDNVNANTFYGLLNQAFSIQTMM